MFWKIPLRSNLAIAADIEVPVPKTFTTINLYVLNDCIFENETYVFPAGDPVLIIFPVGVKLYQLVLLLLPHTYIFVG